MRCTALLRSPLLKPRWSSRPGATGRLWSVKGWICRRCRAPFGFGRHDWSNLQARRARPKWTHGYCRPPLGSLKLYDCWGSAGELLLCRACANDLIDRRRNLRTQIIRLTRLRSPERRQRALEAWADMLACLAFLEEFKRWRARRGARLKHGIGWPFIKHQHSYNPVRELTP